MNINIYLTFYMKLKNNVLNSIDQFIVQNIRQKTWQNEISVYICIRNIKQKIKRYDHDTTRIQPQDALNSG